MRRTRGLALCVLTLLPAAAHPQGVAIEHKQVGCIVVGKYPQLGACFTPASQLARGRVYFRPQGTPSWYYVEMASDQPCHQGVLPRPGKALVGQKIEYYVEGQDRSFNAARTAEFAPVVVGSQQECDKDVPVAPFLTNANVAVFPALPAGFVGAGGIGAATIVGVAAGGAAIAGGAVALSSDDGTTTTTPPVAGNTTTTVVGATTTTTTSSSTTTTTTPRTNRPPQAVLTTSPSPPEGVGPLTVTFDLCASRDPDGDPLSFFFEFGDGTRASGACSQTHTYSSSFRARRVAGAAARTYTFEGSVVDPSGASQSRTREVVAMDPPPPTTPPSPPAGPCLAPTILLTRPTVDECFGSTSVPVSATASNTDQVTFEAFYCADGCGFLDVDDTATASGPGPGYASTLELLNGDGEYLVQATARNLCGGADRTTKRTRFFVDTFFGCAPYSGSGSAFGGRQQRLFAAWSSDLSLAGGRLQVVVNGGGVAFAAAGKTFGMVPVGRGENRIEATVAEAAGKPGTWRFDLMASKGVVPGTLRVLAGEVVTMSPTAVTFRLRGVPGERVAFTFQRK